MGLSLHLKAKLEAVLRCLEPLLLPDSRAVLVPHLGWVSVYAEQLLDLSDIEELAVPLSEMSDVIVLTATQIYGFRKGVIQEQALPDQFPKEAISNFETIQAQALAGLLPIGTRILEHEAEKPGLAEFFGRSQDE